MKQFDLVRFNHERDGGPVHRVVSIMADGMIELHDMEGYFAPHLFVIADDVAAIPADRTPMQRALDAEAQVADLAREVKTLRDEFAMAAANGILAFVHPFRIEPDANEKLAHMAYALADAMLAARKEK